MIKVNSVSGFTLYVQDLDRTAAFYESIGFRTGKRDGDRLVMYVNWFSMTFVPASMEEKPEFRAEAYGEPRGLGIDINISVLNVDDFYAGAVALGLQPASKPADQPWGTREFVLSDPDGYKLVFFQKR